MLDALREHGMLERALISSQYRASLDADPRRRARRAARLVGSEAPPRPVPLRALRAARRSPPSGGSDASLPAARRRGDRAGPLRRADGPLAAGHAARWCAAVRGAGGELYVWTVDELPRLRALEALGVTGVITNDPRLFAALVA